VTTPLGLVEPTPGDNGVGEYLYSHLLRGTKTVACLRMDEKVVWAF
jgi:hypothetical protein